MDTAKPQDKQEQDMGQVIPFQKADPGHDDDQDAVAAYAASVIAEIRAEFPLMGPLSKAEFCRLCDIGNSNDESAGEAAFTLGFLSEWISCWLFSSAKLGYPPGMYVIARLVEAGLDPESEIWHIGQDAGNRDLMVAAYWYQRTSREGYPASIGKAEKLLTKILDDARAGDIYAQFDIGACYETGIFEFLPQQIDEAITWYSRAAAGDNAAAYKALGCIYYFRAYGIKQNEGNAFDNFFEWIRLATARKQRPDGSKLSSKEHRSIGWGYGAILNLACPPCDLAWRIFESEHSEIREQFINEWIESTDPDGFGPRDALLNALIHYQQDQSLEKAKSRLVDFLLAANLEKIASGGIDDDNIGVDPILSLDRIDSLDSWGEPFGSFTGRKFSDPEDYRCRRAEGIIRELAEKGVTTAQWLYGAMLVEHAAPGSEDQSIGKYWLEKAAEQGDRLACLWLAVRIRSGQIKGSTETAKLALARVAYVISVTGASLEDKFSLEPRPYQKGKEEFTEAFVQVLQQRAMHLLQEIELEEAKHHATEQAQRDMLSYLTHTLNNTLSSGPEAARQAMRILGSELYENNREYKAINNIASMFSTFLFAQQLLKTFKLYIAEPEMLRENWEHDTEGEASIAVVLALALRQTLSQVVFSANHQATLQRLLPDRDAGAVKAIRKSFMDEMVSLDVDASNAQQVFDWVDAHVGLIQIRIDPAAELHFRGNSTRFTFFFSGFSELIFNALKYCDGVRPIVISWGCDGERYRFRCENGWTETSTQLSEGSGKGLTFLARLVAMLGAEFSKTSDDGRFVAECGFSIELLKGSE